MKSWKTLAIMAVLLTLVMSSVVPAMASESKIIAPRIASNVNGGTMHRVKLLFYVLLVVDRDGSREAMAGLSEEGEESRASSQLDIYVNASYEETVLVELVGGRYDLFDKRELPHPDYMVHVDIHPGRCYHEYMSIYDDRISKTKKDQKLVDKFMVIEKENFTKSYSFSISITTAGFNKPDTEHWTKSFHINVDVHVSVKKKSSHLPVEKLLSYLNNKPLISKLLEGVKQIFGKEKINRVVQPIPITSRSTISPNIIQPNPTTEPNTESNVQPNPLTTPSTTPSTTNSLITKLFETISEQISNANNAEQTPSTTPNHQATPYTSEEIEDNAVAKDINSTRSIFEEEETSNY